MFLTTYITFFLTFLAALALAANTADFEAFAKYKKGMQAGHVYAFKTGPRLGHQRLIVARITGSVGNLDATAEMFQIYQDDGVKWTKNKPTWECQLAKYRYMGEVDGALSYTDISAKGDNLLIDNTEYKYFTNNCQHHIKDLFKEIKARMLLEEYQRLKREIEATRAAKLKREVIESFEE